jgi:hypothetical protein
VVTGMGPVQGVAMPAWFQDHEEHFWLYDTAKEVKQQDGKYVVIDAYGALLGAHPIDEVKEFSTVIPLPRVND